MKGAGLLAVAAVLAAGSCVVPARSFDAYESKAVNSAESALSQARTAILTAQLAERGRLFAPLASVQLQEAEVGADTAASTFASVQPPDISSDAVRGELLPFSRTPRRSSPIFGSRRAGVSSVRSLEGSSPWSR